MLRIRLALGAAFVALTAAAVAQTAQTTVAAPAQKAQSPVVVRARNATRSAGKPTVWRFEDAQVSTPYALTAANAFDTTKVSPDIENMKVEDAVKRVLEAAGK